MVTRRRRYHLDQQNGSGCLTLQPELHGLVEFTVWLNEMLGRQSILKTECLPLLESEFGQVWQSGFRKSSITFKEDKITPVLGLVNK